MGKKYLTPEKRSRIFTLVESGLSLREVASREGVSHSTVFRVQQGYLQMKSFKDKQKLGRPKILTRREERSIVRQIKSKKSQTAVEIQKKFNLNFETNISVDTVRRTLREYGYVARVKVKKPLLTKKHISQRLNFAKKYSEWTVDDWKKVVWSDESKFSIFGSDGREYCWVKPGSPLSRERVKPTVKYGGGKVLVWGCMTFDGIGYMCKIDNTMDGELYREILSGEFLQTLEWYQLDKSEIIFQHDNDPKHTAKLTKEWFVDNGVMVLDWPSQSPDLNPIEHLWNEIDRRLRKLPSPISSETNLWEQIQTVLNEIPQDFCVLEQKKIP